MIDAHVHLWDPEVGYGWLERAAPVLRRRFTLDDYRASTGAATSVVLVEGNDDRGREDARHLALRDDPRVAAVVTREVRPGAAGSRGPRIDRIDDGARARARACRRLGSTLELLVAGPALGTAVELADLAGGSVVIDHLGDPPAPSAGRAAHLAWHAAMAALADRDGVLVKISGVLGLRAAIGDAALRSAARTVIDLVGVDRVLVGSDWPICLTRGSLADSLGAAIELAGGDERAAAAAAARVYGVGT